MWLRDSSRPLRTFVRTRWAFVFVLLFVLYAPAAWSWGPLGHRIVARIAEREMGEKARSRLAFYLGRDTALADAALWASSMETERPESVQWHFIQIPPNAMNLDLETQCPGSECITVKVREFEGIARLGIRERIDIEESVKYVLHLVADLHQPLHAGYSDDQGGRTIPVVIAGEHMSLYDAWETSLVDRLGSDDAAIADRLSQKITDDLRRRWRDGNLRDWTWESHLLAAGLAYGALPVGSPKRLGPDYTSQAMESIETQLMKAGIRLAKIMDQIWP